MESYYDRIYGYVAFRVPVQDCGDVVGDIFLRAIEKRGQRRAQGDECAWLFAVARSRIAEYYREKGKTMRTASAAASSARLQKNDSLEPLKQLENQEFRERLACALQILTELERDVIALKFSEGLTNTQIAKLLDVTPNNLGVLLHRALGRLREVMLNER
jgi:RNA polymerase sigma-70 factor (ECF subfamily)